MIKRSCENPNRVYVCLFGIRLIFENRRYVGFYHPNLKEVV